MNIGRILVLGEKETFLVRVLVNKSCDAHLQCKFVPWDVDSLSVNLEDCRLMTIYMDGGSRPSKDFMHYLSDTIEDYKIPLIIIGEKDDFDYARKYISDTYICNTFTRPLDSEEYIDVARDVVSRIEKDDFRKTILVVDDDVNYLSVVREWLKDSYKIAMANSGTQALKWLGKNEADLILLDHEMPVTSGPQVLEMLRSEEDTKDIPVIFLTGKSDKESVMQVLSLKPEGYFLKNVDKYELEDKLREFFIKRG